MEGINWRNGSYSNREIGLIAGLAALFLVYAYASSISFRIATRSVDIFFLLAALFTILKCVTRKPWSTTLFAIVTGPIFLLTPAPFPVHITIAVIVNGFIFDLYLRLGRETGPYSRRHLLAAGALGSFVMAAIVFSVLTFLGLRIPTFVYGLGLATDTVAAVLGVLLGIVVVRRISPEYAHLRPIETRRTVLIGAS